MALICYANDCPQSFQGVSFAKQTTIYLRTHRAGGPMNQRINLIVDGTAATVDVDPAMPLLYALRAEVGATSPKFGCGRAQCGACTVHVDGTATRSCVTPVSAVAGKRITTLAGLGTPEKPHPLQTAWIAEQ